MFSTHAKQKEKIKHDLSSTQSQNAQKIHLKKQFSNIMGYKMEPYVNPKLVKMEKKTLV
jgi:hypothetical protein